MQDQDLKETQNSTQSAPNSLFARFRSNRVTLPLLIFLVLMGLLAVTSQRIAHSPMISGIQPSVGAPGDVLLIEGDHFGDTRSGGEVFIGNTRPPVANYLEWLDNRITLKIPPGTESGLITVKTAQGAGEGPLFTNKDHIPLVLDGPSKPGFPYIKEISPDRGSVGTAVTITGSNFGSVQGEARVSFTPLPDSIDSRDRAQSELKDGLQASHRDYDYLSWSDKQITLRVPDSAGSGSIKVTTDRGSSNGMYFEVLEPVGTKLYNRRMGYQIHLNIALSQVIADGDAVIDFWVPSVFNCMEQRNINCETDPEPLWDNYNGFMRYQLISTTPLEKQFIHYYAMFDRYTVETRIDVPAVPPFYNRSSALYEAYTSADSVIELNSGTAQLSAGAVGSERNPYRKAYRIYTYILDNMDPVHTDTETDPLEIWEKGSSDAYGYMLLFCNLLRQTGIPARPVAGFYVLNQSEIFKHYWAEFYITDFGWVPVDLFLGEQHIPAPEYLMSQNMREFCFGNLDNRHIAFTKGVAEISRINPSNQTYFHQRLFSIQTIHEEVPPNVESYLSQWNNIEIIDLW